MNMRPIPSLSEDVGRLIVLVSSRAVLPDRHGGHYISPATILISSVTGKILDVVPEILPASAFPGETQYADKSPHVLMPGLVDAHVHLNEPGRTEWEGFWTGTRAAASGGVTTVVDMPLNAIPPTTTLKGFEEKIEAANGQCWVDVGFYGGVIPGNADELLPLIKAGVKGFKCFLIESGVDEFPCVAGKDIELAMKTLAGTSTTFMFHAEMEPHTKQGHEIAAESSSAPEDFGPLTEYASFLASRPPSFETSAVEEVISHAHLAPDLQLHIVHLSAMEVIPILRKARNDGIKIVAETCFHYLALAAEGVRDGDTRHKCCPPIRSENNRENLWQELLRPDSVIQTVVSDHSPCTPDLKLLPGRYDHDSCGLTAPAVASKRDSKMDDDKEGKLGDFFTAWGGVSSVGLGLPILWTEASKKSDESKISLVDIVRWCCVNTAKQVGLSKQKGALAAGMDADICIFDDEGTFVVERAELLFRNKVSPYQDRRLKGVVMETYVRGRNVFTRGEGSHGFDESVGPIGELLLEERKF